MSLSDWHQAQKEFYDETADEYGENFEQGNPYFDFVVEHYLEATACKPGDRILEIGASGGRFTTPLLERGCKVTAVDISAKSLQYLGQRVADHPKRLDLTLVEDDASVFEKLAERDFDTVAGAHVLHNVEDIRKVLAQLHGRLRAGGRAVFRSLERWAERCGSLPRLFTLNLFVARKA